VHVHGSLNPSSSEKLQESKRDTAVEASQRGSDDLKSRVGSSSEPWDESRGDDRLRIAEAAQRRRWLEFVGRQIAADILRDRAAKEGGAQ
jgi:hypothetical protein